MALSLLSGCAASQPSTPDFSDAETGGNVLDNVPNGEDTPNYMPDDWEAESEEKGDLPFPRAPRWDELQPGETAVQYYDIFIRSVMTEGEAVEAIESSDAYNEQFITWEIPAPTYTYGETNYTKLDNEVSRAAATAGL